jgi:hypothetical protein
MLQSGHHGKKSVRIAAKFSGIGRHLCISRLAGIACRLSAELPGSAQHSLQWQACFQTKQSCTPHHIYGLNRIAAARRASLRLKMDKRSLTPHQGYCQK